MLSFFVVFVAVCSGGAFGQLFDVAVSMDGKSEAPTPTLLEMPYEKLTLPNLGPAAVSEVTRSSVSVASPMIDVPKRFESVVDIPHATIPLPQGGVEQTPVEYNIPHPVIDVPEPLYQKKRVFFNVPQPIIQVPEPVIRHRPIIYKAAYSVNVHRPLVKHQKIFYDVPSAQLKPKSGYAGHY